MKAPEIWWYAFWPETAMLVPLRASWTGSKCNAGGATTTSVRDDSVLVSQWPMDGPRACGSLAHSPVLGSSLADLIVSTSFLPDSMVPFIFQFPPLCKRRK